MEKKDILQKVAPCSLMCHTCSGYKNGVICETSGKLLKYLNGMKEFYKKHIPEAVENYNIFEEVLLGYNLGLCSGCRSREHNGCSIKGCFILDCIKEHDVEFCGECNEFPCNKTEVLFEDEVYRQWLDGNYQIKENGIEAYWKNNCEKPHYEAYKKEK